MSLAAERKEKRTSFGRSWVITRVVGAPQYHCCVAAYVAPLFSSAAVSYVFFCAVSLLIQQETDTFMP